MLGWNEQMGWDGHRFNGCWPAEVSTAHGKHVARMKTPLVPLVGGPWNGSKWRMYGGKVEVFTLFGNGDGAYVLAQNDKGKDIYKWVPSQTDE